MIGIRLKEERERLALTQENISKEINISKRTFIEWEKGKTYPTAYQLSALQLMGMDTNYIITGLHKTLIETPEEEVLLKAYRGLNLKAKKDILLKVMEAEQKNNKKEKTKSISIKGNNNSNNILGSNIKVG